MRPSWRTKPQGSHWEGLSPGARLPDSCQPLLVYKKYEHQLKDSCWCDLTDISINILMSKFIVFSSKSNLCSTCFHSLWITGADRYLRPSISMAYVGGERTAVQKGQVLPPWAQLLRGTAGPVIHPIQIFLFTSLWLFIWNIVLVLTASFIL